MKDDKVYRIGRFELILPADHALDQYQQHFRLYDRLLGEIARLLVAKYPDAAAIDIGANVGDTAALLCREQDMPILCIEGHPQFVSYLRRNLERLPPCIEVAECLVGARAGSVPLADLHARDGTAALQPGAQVAAGAPSLAVRRLAEILAEHPRFGGARLLKTDTDGADFEILLSSLDVIRKHRPVLYFEYDPTLRVQGTREATEVVAALTAEGYRYFLVFDNYGNFMTCIEQDAADRFGELDRYLLSHLLFGRRVHYLDVCAFSADDEDLCRALEVYQRELVESGARESGREI